MKKYLITSALPYINGIKHLGNIIGSLLPADVYTRFLKQQGEDAIYICGTDEHGTPAELAADEAGLPVAQFCEEMYEKQKAVYEGFNIEFDYFGRSSSKENHHLTQEIFTALDKNGYIEEKSEQHIFSKADDRFLPDRYVIGECPHCGYKKARGDQCDGCGRLLEPTQLKNPISAISGSADLEVRESKHLYIKLSALQPMLSEWLKTRTEWPSFSMSIANKWLSEGLHDRCISRDLKWGIPIPKAGFENKVFYVWFDAPIAYISLTKEWASQIKHEPDFWKHCWRTDVENNTTYVQFMAKDNVPFHSVLWPAMLLGTKEPWKMVDILKGFNWLNYEGGKFSTSQGRGVFSDVALNLFPADYWRYYLLANVPESSDTDFTFDHFADTVNKDLADVLGNFINRVVSQMHKYFDGAVPAYRANNDDVTMLTARCDELMKSIRENLYTVKFRPAMQLLRELWSFGNSYIAEAQPWKVYKTDPEKAADMLVNALHLIRLFAIAMYPMMPSTAEKIFEMLAEKAPRAISYDNAVCFNAIEPGRYINKLSLLFEKIDAERVEELKATFAGK